MFGDADELAIQDRESYERDLEMDELESQLSQLLQDKRDLEKERDDLRQAAAHYKNLYEELLKYTDTDPGDWHDGTWEETRCCN